MKVYEIVSIKIIEKCGACMEGEAENAEVAQYLREPLITFHRANSYLCMVEGEQTSFHSTVTVNCQLLARRYLASPPTSVASEKFSTAGGMMKNEID